MIEIIIKGTCNSGKSSLAKIIAKTLKIFNIKTEIEDDDTPHKENQFLGSKLDKISKTSKIIKIKTKQISKSTFN